MKRERPIIVVCTMRLIGQRVVSQMASIKLYQWAFLAIKSHPFLFIFTSFISIILLIHSAALCYLWDEFVWHSHFSLDVDCLDLETNTSFPRIIHQIYTGYDGKPIPEKYIKNMETWMVHNPGYKFFLWNASTLEGLITQKYPELKDLYFGYSQWINRVDMSKYIVMHEYGGYYADLDIKSVKTNISFPVNFYTGVVLYKQFLLGIKADFMASKPKHIFLRHILSGLDNANRWYLVPHLTTMFRAGPLFLHGRYLNYPCKDQVKLLSPEDAYKYFHDDHSGSWHSFDTKILDVFFDNLYMWTFMLCAVIIISRQRKNISSFCNKHKNSSNGRFQTENLQI